jgi:hypothetical protein
MEQNYIGGTIILINSNFFIDKILCNTNFNLIITTLWKCLAVGIGSKVELLVFRRVVLSKDKTILINR